MKNILFAALAIALACAGCRREDVRTYEMSIPGLTEANRPKVEEALMRYAGVRRDSYKWDYAKKTLTLEFDSMQVARENLHQAIEAQGIAVARPPKTDEHAGY